MIRVFPWVKQRRFAYRRSFSARLETKDRGLYYYAIVRYRWRLNSLASAPRLLTPDAFVRHLLAEVLVDLAKNYRLLDDDIAQNAMNATLSREMQDDEHRVCIEGRVQLRIRKSEKIIALQRIKDEAALRTAHARETVELDLLLGRLIDPSLGPIWWINKYADLQFSAGDPAEKMQSILTAFVQLRDMLNAAEIDQTTESQLLVRRKIHEVFSAIRDERTLRFALEVMNRTLDHMGLAEYGDSVEVSGGNHGDASEPIEGNA